MVSPSSFFDIFISPYLFWIPLIQLSTCTVYAYLLLLTSLCLYLYMLLRRACLSVIQAMFLFLSFPSLSFSKQFSMFLFTISLYTSLEFSLQFSRFLYINLSISLCLCKCLNLSPALPTFLNCFFVTSPLNS